MSSIQKVRTYVYDTPATYDQFNGGINTNLSNEALEPNEIRDGLNCHYVNQSLCNRKGEKIIKTLDLPINTRPQGDFLFSADHNDYIISVRNGHIFYGIYEPTVSRIPMRLLLIDIQKTESRDDPTNYIVDLKEDPPDITDHNSDEDTEGYIYTVPSTGEGEGGSGDPGSSDEQTLRIQNTKRVQGVPIKMTIEDRNNDGTKEEYTYFVMATGTRILRIAELETGENSGQYFLYGYIMEAYVPSIWYYQTIGVNNFSPFPNYLLEGTQKTTDLIAGAIQTNPKEIDADELSTGVTAKIIMDTPLNVDVTDLYFKWEVKVGYDSAWRTIWFWDASLNGGGSSKGKDSITITQSDLEACKGSPLVNYDPETYPNPDIVLIRCTATSDFQETWDRSSSTLEKDRGEEEYDINGNPQNDFVSDISKAKYTKTQIEKTVQHYDPEEVKVDQEFLNLHSCIKVAIDGTKLIFYDDAYDSGEWYNTVPGICNYSSYKGNIDFRTDKREKLIGVVVFDSNIVVFSDNELLGGNISVISGNGDVYNRNDGYYSPYKRVVVNTNVSCDSYNTIQVCENYIIFKYRRDIYMLDTNELDAERVNVITINDKVKQRLNGIEFPLDRIRMPQSNEDIYWDFHQYNRCLKPDEIFSECCNGYYGIIFPHQGFYVDTWDYPENALISYPDGGNPEYVEHLRGRKIEDVTLKPGLRWKCYFRNGQVYQDSPKTFFPWLRDTTHYLNIVSVININGESTMVTENAELVQFIDDEYKGEEDYKVRITTKCYDQGLPTLCKFMDNLNVYYNRDFSEIFYANMYVKNESGYYIYHPNDEAYISMQTKPFGEVKFDERYKVDDALNLLPGYEPMEQYDEYPYIDPMDKPVQILGETLLDTATLDRPSFTSVTLTPKYRFPYLSAQYIIEMLSNQAFALSSITWSFTSNDMPDFTREKLYREILKGSILR